MSQKRQGAQRLIGRTLAIDYQGPGALRDHAHADWAQLIYAPSGVLNVETEDGSWVVPPQHAVWVPPAVAHSGAFSRALSLRTLYVHATRCRGLSQRCQVVSVTPLLRELILEAVRGGALDAGVPEHVRLLGVILDQLATSQPDPLELRLPRDRRALRVVDRLRDDPGDRRTIDELCVGTGASKRTIERLFLQETGATLGRWRRQLRLTHAIRLLAGGTSVTQAALAVGYESPSAFIAMFGRALGTSPSQYVG